MFQPSSLEIFLQFEGTGDRTSNMMIISFDDDLISDKKIDGNLNGYSTVSRYYSLFREKESKRVRTLGML